MFKHIDEVIALFSQLNKPIVVLDKHRVVAINSLLAEIFSVEGHLLIGKTILDFSPEFQEDNIPSDELSHDYINRAYLEGHVEFRWIHKDIFQNAILCTVNLNKIQVGNSIFLMAILENIKYIPKLTPEEQKEYIFSNNIRIKTLLGLKTENQQSLFNISKSPICISDFDGSFLEVNDSWKKLLAWSNDQPENKPFIDFVHPDDRLRTLKAFSILTKGHDLYLFKSRYQDVKGDYISIRWSILSYKITKKFLAIAEIIY